MKNDKYIKAGRKPGQKARQMEMPADRMLRYQNDGICGRPLGACLQNIITILSSFYIVYKVYQQKIMKELGVKVLSKIENLISEIDKPQVPIRNPKKQGQQQQQYTVEQADSRQPRGVTRSQYYANKMSYGYLDREKKTLQKLINHSYKVELPTEQFRITNKQTIEILKKKDLKPIHQRLEEVLDRKQMHINLLLQQKTRKERDSMLPETYPNDYSPGELVNKYRKMNLQDLAEFEKIYHKKNHLRLQKRHLHQLSRIDKETAEAVPVVSSHSKSLSKIRNLKKNYSADVFKRMNQDCLDRGGRKSQLLSKIVEEQGGFKPVLCVKSLLLAEQSRSKRSLSPKALSHSSHKKCKTSICYTPSKKLSRSPLTTNLKEQHSSTPIKTAPSENKPSAQKIKYNKNRLPLAHKEPVIKARSPLKAQSKSNRLLNALQERDRNEALRREPKFIGAGRIEDRSLAQNISKRKTNRNNMISFEGQKSKGTDANKKSITSTLGAFSINVQTGAKTPKKSVRFDKKQSLSNAKQYMRQ